MRRGESIPRAHVVIDHFHVIQWALSLTTELMRNLQVVRKKKFKVVSFIRKPPHKLKPGEWRKLEACFPFCPELGSAWKLAQEVRVVYTKKNWRKANSQLRKTIRWCFHSHIPEMEALEKTLKRWKWEILNFYISRATNACAEGLHSRLETIKRAHCGIKNIERFAKRLTFCMLPFAVIVQQFAQSF